jgi:hypothetical protein
MKRKTCDKCSHYTLSTEYANEGKCALTGDSNDGPIPVDRAVGWDFGGYRAGVYVGPKFGCIHWVKKELA